jgi:predicted SAM-dependent methyltransferase
MGRLSQRLRYIATTGLRRRVRDRVVGVGPAERFVVREDLARRYLRGDGIEIGAETWPMRLPPGARVRYVDRLSRADYIAEYGDAIRASDRDPYAMPETDVIDDAGTLATLADGSVDFVVANHVLEHLEDPIAALENFLRVLRPGGVLFLTLPDARHSFDARRERTTVEHLLRDHREGPQVSRREHYEEWAAVIEGASGPAVAERVAAFEREDARHHFHVWELDDFLALLRALELPCVLEAALVNDTEFAVVLRATT